MNSGLNKEETYNYNPSFEKPIIAILNTASGEIKNNAEAARKVFGVHWLVLVILPQEFKGLLGEKNQFNEGDHIILFDSLGQNRTLPSYFQKALCTYMKFERELEDNKEPTTYEIPPLVAKNSTFTSHTSTFLQDANSCGYWAIFNAIMAVLTGTDEFFLQFSTADGNVHSRRNAEQRLKSIFNDITRTNEAREGRKLKRDGTPDMRCTHNQDLKEEKGEAKKRPRSTNQSNRKRKNGELDDPDVSFQIKTKKVIKNDSSKEKETPKGRSTSTTRSENDIFNTPNHPGYQDISSIHQNRNTYNFPHISTPTMPNTNSSTSPNIETETAPEEEERTDAELTTTTQKAITTLYESFRSKTNLSSFLAQNSVSTLERNLYRADFPRREDEFLTLLVCSYISDMDERLKKAEAKKDSSELHNIIQTQNQKISYLTEEVNQLQHKIKEASFEENQKVNTSILLLQGKVESLAQELNQFSTSKMKEITLSLARYEEVSISFSSQLAEMEKQLKELQNNTGKMEVEKEIELLKTSLTKKTNTYKPQPDLIALNISIDDLQNQLNRLSITVNENQQAIKEEKTNMLIEQEKQKIMGNCWNQSEEEHTSRTHDTRIKNLEKSLQRIDTQLTSLNKQGLEKISLIKSKDTTDDINNEEIGQLKKLVYDLEGALHKFMDDINKEIVPNIIQAKKAADAVGDRLNAFWKHRGQTNDTKEDTQHAKIDVNSLKNFNKSLYTKRKEEQEKKIYVRKERTQLDDPNINYLENFFRGDFQYYRGIPRPDGHCLVFILKNDKNTNSGKSRGPSHAKSEQGRKWTSHNEEYTTEFEGSEDPYNRKEEAGDTPGVSSPINKSN